MGRSQKIPLITQVRKCGAINIKTKQNKRLRLLLFLINDVNFISLHASVQFYCPQSPKKQEVRCFSKNEIFFSDFKRCVLKCVKQSLSKSHIQIKSQKRAVWKMFLKIENYGKLSETAQAAELHHTRQILHVKSSTCVKDGNISRTSKTDAVCCSLLEQSIPGQKCIQ